MAAKEAPHIVVMSKAFLVLRIFQIIFALIPLGICIFGVIYVALDAFILNIFTGIATIITLIYILVATYGAPSIYQYWAILSLEIFCLIFWLVSFAVLASDVAIVSEYLNYSSYNYRRSKYKSEYYWAAKDFIAIFGGCCGAGAIEFIFFIISLSMFSVAMARHRRNGGHCVPDTTTSAAPAYTSGPNQNFGSEKMTVPQAQAYPVQNANGGYATQQQYQPAPQQIPQQYQQQQYQYQ